MIIIPSTRLNSSIRLRGETLKGTIILGQSWTRSNGNEGVLHILQSSWTGASPSDGLSGTLGWELLPKYIDAVKMF